MRNLPNITKENPDIKIYCINTGHWTKKYCKSFLNNLEILMVHALELYCLYLPFN